MKKVLAILFVCLIGFTSSVEADDGMRTLYKFDLKEDGTYGYTEEPVKYYQGTKEEPESGSTEDIQISDNFELKKQEFRGMWVATVANLNVKITTTKEEYQAEFIKILDNIESYNMNALIFQVKPALDAFYPSEVSPWSEYLMGEVVDGKVVKRQGIDPGWDPLAWMIEQTHARGIEFHAWFNPYRVTVADYRTAAMQAKLGKTDVEMDAMTNSEVIALLNEKGVLADNNYAVLNPTSTLRFLGKFILDPGIPAVQEYVASGIKEVAQNYDIDAVHFDDYFYPYRVGKTYFESEEDRNTFETHGIPNGYEDTQEGLEEWRRDGVTKLMKDIHDMLAVENATNGKAIQFGISPFGIWEHKKVNPLGSNTPTDSSSSYSKQIYADVYKWIKEGIIDYATPQLYWYFDQQAAPYGELARWWANAVEGTDVNLYIGHANYKHVSFGAGTPAWMNSDEIPNQLKFNQQYPNIKGSIMFSYNDMIKSNIAALPAADQPRHEVKNEMIDKVKDLYLQSKPSTPVNRMLPDGNANKVAPAAVTNAIDLENGSFTWQASESTTQRYYVIYRQEKSAFTSVADMTADARNMHHRVWADGSTNYTYTPVTTYASGDYVYAVSTFNRANLESSAVVFNPATTTPPVTPPTTPTPTAPSTKPSTQVATQSKPATGPNTGDISNVAMLQMLLAVAVVGLAGYGVMKKKYY